MIPTLLLYQNLKRKLIEYVFKMNLCYSCTTNTDIHGGQLTMNGHMYDVNEFCKNCFEIMKLFSYANKVYRNKMVACQDSEKSTL